MLDPDELALRRNITILEKQLDDFLEIPVKLVQCLALAVRAGETRHPTDVKSGIGVALDDGGVGLHQRIPVMFRSTDTRGRDQFL